MQPRPRGATRRRAELTGSARDPTTHSFENIVAHTMLMSFDGTPEPTRVTAVVRSQRRRDECDEGLRRKCAHARPRVVDTLQ
jgi:hypothetical protein